MRSSFAFSTSTLLMLFLPFFSGLAADSALPSVTVRNLPRPGAFQIENIGPPVRLSGEVHIEQQVGRQWQELAPVIHLIESCWASVTQECPEIDPHKVITPVPWSGFSCSVQCPTKCKKNAYLGPGTFRFVLTTCDKSRKFYSDPFTLPTQQ